MTLAHKNSNKKITVEFNEADYFLLWTKPDAGYICLEPWCGVQDIIGSDYDITKKEGIRSLQPKGVFEFRHIIECAE